MVEIISPTDQLLNGYLILYRIIRRMETEIKEIATILTKQLTPLPPQKSEVTKDQTTDTLGRLGDYFVFTKFPVWLHH